MGTEQEERFWNTIKASVYIINMDTVMYDEGSLFKSFVMVVRLFGEMTTDQI